MRATHAIFQMALDYVVDFLAPFPLSDIAIGIITSGDYMKVEYLPN